MQAGQDDSQACDKPHAGYFLEYGWPNTLVSDSGPCYNATEFKKIIKDMAVHHIKVHQITINPISLAYKYVSLLSKANPNFILMLYKNIPFGL